MALPHLNEEQIRTWTPEQKDRWWLENVFRGDMPQLTLRAAATGFLLGGILSATNLYVGAKTGWSLGVGVTSVILAFAIFRVLSTTGLMRDITILENNAVQSIATAAGYMTAPLISSLTAYMLVINKPLPWYQLLVWNILASVLGVLVAFPMKRRFINNEQQPFPEGRACAVVLDSLYPDAPPGGTARRDPVQEAAAARAALEEQRALGILKAKVLFAAAAIAGTIQFFVGEHFQRLVQEKLLGLKEVVFRIPEELFGWYYALAEKNASLWIPRLQGIDIRQLGINPALDLAMLGAGGLMGTKIANSLMIGCILNYVVIAPAMIHSQEILPKNLGAIIQPDGSYDIAAGVFGRSHLLNTWCLWWGVSMMVVASLVGLFAKPKMLMSAFTGVFKKRSTGDDCLKHVEFPLWISLVGVPVMTAVTVLMNWYWFEVPLFLGLLAIPLIILLTLIAANATALTSTTPTGSLSKITQFTFGAADPGHPATNLVTAGMTAEVASNASNLLMDIKPGYMLGAKPRQQAWGHLIGIFSGAIASTPLFFLLFLSDWKGDPATQKLEDVVITDKFGFPGVVQWKAVADLIAGLDNAAKGTVDAAAQAVQAVGPVVAKVGGVLPTSAAWAMVIAGIAALVFEIARMATRGRFPLSAVAIGLGVVIPPESTLMMWLGALLFAGLARLNRTPGTTGHKIWVESQEPLCAGLIAGWAILGIGDAVLRVLVFS
jgi:OPT family oligopeptide transporter